MMASTVMATTIKQSQPNNPQPIKQVRKLFPETWLWTNFTVSDSGMTSLNVKVPDTITSWVATAFAVNDEAGLGLTPQPSNLNVFMPFFVQLVLPYSVIRGELVVLQINIHNYLPTNNWVLVLLDPNNGMDNVITYVNRIRKRLRARRVGRWIRVPKGGIGSAYFPIVPTQVGQLKISVSARTSTASDAIEKNLLVEPSGTPQEYNTPVLIDLKTVGTFSKKVNITFPKKTSPGSRRISASVIGDLMGPSINGSEKLIKMPYGCGEQNMLNFAPNIFVRKYLSITNNLKSDMDAKSKEYMVKGYQRELTYQHDDGSFSAFGDSDPSGTTWLTSFVVKSFAQARKYIFVDDKLVLKALDWLVLQQDEQLGTFKEPGKVLHKAMQGGSASGERSLAAFVLIAMKEADAVPGASKRTARAIKRATTFLEGELDKMIDTYEMAIVAYALKLAGSPMSSVILERLETLAVIEDGTKHWAHNEQESQADKYLDWKPPHSQSNAIDIELTSYILLNYAISNNINGGLPVLRWLTSQRNPAGGFSSTQDTIIALQALAEFAGEIYSADFNMRITIQSSKGEPFTDSYTITPENALVLQTFEIPPSVEEITVLANGKGVALAEIAVNFHTDDDIKTSSFDVNTTLTNETKNGFIVKVCGRWTRPKESGMAIMEIGIPSGMTPDLESLDLSESRDYKRKEELFRKLVLYYDKFDSEPQCVSLRMMRVDRVAEQQPSPVRIYDYYEPSNQKTTFYSSALLSKSSICDVCGSECFCRNTRT